MDLYLVVYKSEYLTQEAAISFNSEEKAINCASQIASNGSFGVSEADHFVREAKLVNVIKFNPKSLKGANCELLLENGRFALKEKKITRKNS